MDAAVIVQELVNGFLDGLKRGSRSRVVKVDVTLVISRKQGNSNVEADEMVTVVLMGWMRAHVITFLIFSGIGEVNHESFKKNRVDCLDFKITLNILLPLCDAIAGVRDFL